MYSFINSSARSREVNVALCQVFVMDKTPFAVAAFNVNAELIVLASWEKIASKILNVISSGVAFASSPVAQTV